MNIVAIVQARMTSARLPGKMLMPLNNMPAITQVFKQLKFSKLINTKVLATSEDISDSPLVEWAEKNKIKYYQGDLNNVLKRYYDASRFFKADVIVRITGDCPLIDPEIIDNTIKLFLSGNYDYVSNVMPPTFPDGYDTEVFSFTALENAFKNAILKSDKEHVTAYITNNEVYKKANYSHSEDLSKYRLTLDYEDDYLLIKNIFENIKTDSYIKLQDVMKYLKNNLHLIQINSEHKRNEGYIKSLKEDNNG